VVPRRRDPPHRIRLTAIPTSEGAADGTTSTRRARPRTLRRRTRAAALEVAATFTAKSPVLLRLRKEVLSLAQELPMAEGYGVEQLFGQHRRLPTLTPRRSCRPYEAT